MTNVATINGKPSVFLTTEIPTEQFPVYTDRVADFADIAESMASESVNPEAEARNLTNCVNCQAEIMDWRTANPTADASEADDALRETWETCPACVAEFSEWSEAVDRQNREAELETAEQEAWEAHLEAQAEEAELARLGEAYLIGANTNHDLIWQQGGVV